MLEANRYNEKITHCMCLVREDEGSPYRVLSPCGVCLRSVSGTPQILGADVQVAVTAEYDEPLFVELGKLQPYHRTLAYQADEPEHWEQ